MIETIACGYNIFCHLENMVEHSKRQAPIIRYYEPGKSCYVNGTFYSKCEDSLNGIK
jgi:hypothetical protein